MACREVEMGKTKCERYWPELKDVTKDYGVMKVTMVSPLTEEPPENNIRSLGRSYLMQI